jgi:alpha-beta hydrolase superfamily lysophospholipase
MTKKKTVSDENVVIKAPAIDTANFKIVGTAPYVQLRFSQKAINTMMEKHKLGSQAKKKTQKEARDFDEDFRQAMHVSTEGWAGIPAGAFRNGLISACRLVGFKMTLAKLSLFVGEDGFDSVDAVPLIKIEGEAEPLIMHARNATGVCDIRVRAKFWPWSATLRVSYDTDQFSTQDVANLLLRVGQQVGIGEGRPDSKMSAGMGWGTFRLE